MTQAIRMGLTAAVVFLLGGRVPAHAGWEIALGGVSDSNVNRSVHDATADTYLNGSAGYTRDVSGDRRLDWTAAVTVEGAVYSKVTDLNSVSLDLAPGIAYVPRAGWTLELSPFFEPKSVADGNQSAVAWGVRFNVVQRLGSNVYLGEHYTYTDSNAREDVFSYRAHALSACAGYNWTPFLATELGYRYAHGDSFRTLRSPGPASGDTVQQGAPGKGPGGTGVGGHHGIHDLGGEVVKETVTTHELSAALGYSWTQAVASYLGCTFSVSEGDTGTSRSRIGYLSSSYRF